MNQQEGHRTHRISWLRAAVLGANDGIVSTSSLVLGVAAAHGTRGEIITAGVAGLVAGAMSMAAGEYVSVSSQADVERAELERERRHLRTAPKRELEELVGIYEERGLDAPLARRVAEQLTKHDALAAHARDELGITDASAARPIQAAVSSASTFAVGALFPLLAAIAVPTEAAMVTVVVTSLICLALLGVMSARAGGARVPIATARVTFWGALAMAVTAAVGTAFGAIG